MVSNSIITSSGSAFFQPFVSEDVTNSFEISQKIDSFLARSAMNSSGVHDLNSRFHEYVVISVSGLYSITLFILQAYYVIIPDFPAPGILRLARSLALRKDI